CLEYLDTFITKHPSFTRYFKYVFIPDESFFQSILSNSPFQAKILSNNLRYADWDNPNPKYPKTLDMSDFEKLKSSPFLFARKLDPSHSRELLNRLDELLAELD